MTMFKVGNTYWEWTILLDTFNNEILAHSVTSQAGSNKPYYHCLDELKKRMDKREEQTSQVVLHTDQELSTLHRLFARPTIIITYFALCREGVLPQITQLLKPSTAGSRKNSISTSTWPMPLMSPHS